MSKRAKRSRKLGLLHRLPCVQTFREWVTYTTYRQGCTFLPHSNTLLCPTTPGVLLAGARCPPCEMPIFQNRLLSRFQTPRSRWSRVSSSYPPLHDARSAKSSASGRDKPLTMKSSKRDTEGNPYDKRIRIFC